MADRSVWIQTDGGEPSVEWLRLLGPMGVHYNGAGRFRAVSATAADAGISWFRARGVEATRAERPKADRMTTDEAFAVARSVSAPQRWTL